tara:strand:+ start:108 stop:425 length:318 start_codon:yes stop_codon:yes gene_type:complete
LLEDLLKKDERLFPSLREIISGKHKGLVGKAIDIQLTFDAPSIVTYDRMDSRNDGFGRAISPLKQSTNFDARSMLFRVVIFFEWDASRVFLYCTRLGIHLDFQTF